MEAAAEPNSEATDAPPAPTRLSGRQKSLYACGDVADAIKNVILAQFLLYYLTVACGLTGSLAGATLFVALVVDAITDPLFGYLSDNTRSRWGRRHPYMFLAAVPFALALGLLFSMPDFESRGARFAYAMGMLVTLRVAFSAFVLPYAAMTAELATDYTERTVLMTYRNFFNICGNATTVTLGFGVFLAADGALESRTAYAPFGWTCALLVLVAVIVSSVSTYGIRDRLKDVSAAPRVPLRRVGSEMKEVFSNQSFRVLALTVVVFWVAQGTAGSLAVHAFRHFWSLEPETIRDIAYANIVGLALGIPLCAVLLKRFEKKEICAGGLAAFCFSQFIAPVAYIAGWIPESELVIFGVLSFFALGTGLAMTCVAVTFGSMMADATDEHELKFGTRREGLYFSGLTFGGKCAIGLGAFVGGIGLDLIGFPSDLGTNPDQVLAASTVRDLGLIAGPGAALISLASVMVLMRHRLDSSAHERIRAELARRFSAAPSDGAWQPAGPAPRSRT